MLSFRTGEGRVLRFVLLPLGKIPTPPLLCRFSGWYGVTTCVLGNTSHTRAYTITIQPFVYYLGVPRR
jgi:hypothetical protein